MTTCQEDYDEKRSCCYHRAAMSFQSGPGASEPFESLIYYSDSGMKYCPPFRLTSSAVGRLLWFKSDGPGVGGHDVSPSMDAAGINALVELVGNDAKVSVLHDNVAGDGGQDLLAIFVPAGQKQHEDRLQMFYLFFTTAAL